MIDRWYLLSLRDGRRPHRLFALRRKPSSMVNFNDPMVAAAVALGVACVLIALFMALGGGSKKKFLNKTRQTVTLGSRTNLSHDVVRFRFNLPKETPVLGLPVGQHFTLYAPNTEGKVKGQWNGREDPSAGEPEIERKYTPTTSDDEIGYVDLVIKVYKGGVVKKPDPDNAGKMIDVFPDGGKMSQYLDTLKVSPHELPPPVPDRSEVETHPPAHTHTHGARTTSTHLSKLCLSSLLRSSAISVGG